MFKKFSSLFTLLFSLALLAKPVQVITSIAPPEVTLPAGSKVKFIGRITSGDNLPEGAKVLYEEIVDGITKNKGFAAVDEEISLEKQLNEPGHYLVRLQLVDAAGKPVQINGKKIMDGRGVMTSPEKIQPSAPRPADFDAFWDGRRAMLDAVPVKELERRDVSSAPNSLLVAYDVKVACAGSKPLSGILTMPRNATPRSLPAFVFFQGAGVSSAVSFGGYGKAAMTFMVNAHGIDNLRDKSYYRDLDRGALKQYAHFNKDDREKIYFHDMFLRVMRALDYVKSLPQWNGRILVVRGGSQGGAQAVVAAAMDPQVTMMIAEVPAMCDHNGFRAKPIRRCG
ncbi:MAG: acetylxylan esterase [Victivallales bacterium]|nr:acetylxylan esterase [Victivallales bacterium]